MKKKPKKQLRQAPSSSNRYDKVSGRKKRNERVSAAADAQFRCHDAGKAAETIVDSPTLIALLLGPEARAYAPVSLSESHAAEIRDIAMKRAEAPEFISMLRRK